MKQYIQKLEQFITTRDIWLYLFIAPAILIITMTERLEETDMLTWTVFAKGLSILLLYQFPVFVFLWYKPKLKQVLSPKKYNLVWFGSLILYPPFSILLESGLLLGDPWLKFQGRYEFESVSIVSIITIVLSIALRLNAYFDTKPILIQWVQRIGIDRTLLGMVAFFSLLLGAMAASNMDVFYERHLIKPDINTNLFPNFFHFITISIQIALHYLVMFFFYYINRYLLIPQLLKKKGLLYFICGALATVILFYPVLAQLLMWLPIAEHVQLLPSQSIMPNSAFAPVNGGVAAAIVFCSTPIILILDWFKQNAELSNLEKQKVAAELGLLKQQINPHFFFNTLNNLYALSIQRSMQTPEVILQLSELMRYVIYKGQENTVALAEELKYIEDYIQLQQIRLKKKLQLSIDKEIENDKVQIPPLLLIILVENAFKHGIEPAEDIAFLDIEVRCDSNELYFLCKNSREPLANQTSGGLGLTNLKRRLELHFPKKHELFLYDDDFNFEASIKIQLA